MTEVRKYLLFSAYDCYLTCKYILIFFVGMFFLISPSDCQVPEQPSQGTHDG